MRRVLKRLLRVGRRDGAAACISPCLYASKSAPGHKIYPYLVRGVKIERANHVWARDITYIPMRRGFVYLAAVVDVASRRVLAHRLSITMEAAFCIKALDEALARPGQASRKSSIRTKAASSPVASSRAF